MNSNALIIFLKYPKPGYVKTRLAKDIGNSRAAEFYKIMTEDIVQKVCVGVKNYDVHFFVSSSEEQRNTESWLQLSEAPKVQRGNDLGERMLNAFREIFDCGYGRVVIIGTDCPKVNGHVMEEAMDALEQSDVVLGPTFDGGYYLLGLKAPWPDLFLGIMWSTDSVFFETLNKINNQKRSVAVLNQLRDMDTLEDLKVEGYGHYSSL